MRFSSAGKVLFPGRIFAFLIISLLLFQALFPALGEGGLAFSISSALITPGENVSIYYDLPREGALSVTLLDGAGETAAVLMDGQVMQAGFHEALWNGLDHLGTPMPEGSYTLRLSLDGEHMDMAVVIGPARAQTAFSFGAPTDVPQDAVVITPTSAPPRETPAPTQTPAPAPAQFTPAFRSSHIPAHSPDGCYWCTPMDIGDEEAVWNMLTSPIYTVKAGQREQVIVREEPDERSSGLGVVTGESMGLHVLENRKDGWSLVECYSASFHDSRVKNWNAYITGYIKTSQIEKIIPDQTFGVVIDKLTQRLYLFKEGHLFSTLLVSTGLYNSKQPYNETRSGEFLLVSKVGHFQSDSMKCRYALRFDSGDLLHEVPHVENADGGRNYKATEYKLGTRASHGCIRVQRLKNPEGVNMMWLYDNLAVGGNHPTKLVIWEDFAGRTIPYPSDDTLLYYNPNNGSNYHTAADCNGVKEQYRPLTAFTYGELDTGSYAKLTACPYCYPPLRKAEIDQVNRDHETVSPGMVSDYHQAN